MKIVVRLACAVVIMALSQSAWSANPAGDSATNNPYVVWSTDDNGGFGFDPWTNRVAGAASTFFISDNGNPNSPDNV